VFVVVCVVFIFGLSYILSIGNGEFSKKEKGIGKNLASTDYKFVEPTNSGLGDGKEKKDFEELVGNFVKALCFIDKDPSVLDEYVENGSVFEKELKEKKEFIGKEFSKVEIEKLEFINGMYKVAVRVYFTDGSMNKEYLVKMKNQRYVFVAH
jgi:hypothetical protein